MIATLGHILVEFLTFPTLTTGTIDNLKLFDDPNIANDRRIDIGTLSVTVSGSIGTLVEFRNLRLSTTNLSVNLDTARSVSVRFSWLVTVRRCCPISIRRRWTGLRQSAMVTMPTRSSA